MVDRPQSPSRPAPVLSLLRTGCFYLFSAIYLPFVILVAWIERDAYYRFVRFWVHATLRLFGIRVEGSGAQQLEAGRDYVLVANHRSHFDSLAIVATLGARETRWVAKRELGRIPIFGFGLRATGQIMIDRGDHEQAIAALERNLGVRGVSIVFFGEGRRSRDGSLQPFKKGAAAFGIAAQVPVVPVAVVGSERVLPKYALLPRPGTIRVGIGRPADTTGLTKNDRGALTLSLHEAVAELLRQMEGAPQGKHD